MNKDEVIQWMEARESDLIKELKWLQEAIRILKRELSEGEKA